MSAVPIIALIVSVVSLIASIIVYNSIIDFFQNNKRENKSL